MSNSELKEHLNLMKSELKAELQTQNTIIDEVIRPKIESILVQVTKTNGRVSECEKMIDHQKWICDQSKINKEKSLKNQKIIYLSQVIISAIMAALIMKYGILELIKFVK